MKSLQKQQGMGLLNILVLILVCIFIGKFAFTVVPMYTENRYIVSGLKELVKPGKKLEEMSDSQIKGEMEKFYMINNVTSDVSKKIVIARNAAGVVIKIDYDTRDTFFYNIDLVLHFDNHLDSSHPTLCCKPLAEPPSAKY